MNTNEYLFCTRCGSEEFTPKPDAVLEQEFRGETLQVPSPAMACTKCGSLALTTDQIAELRKRTADAYRKKHNLLTSAQIRAMREALGKSQREFAAFLRVGEASIKRWETWLVQDASNDELIRVKCLLAKKADMIKRTADVLRQRAASQPLSPDWEGTAEQAKALLTSLSRYVTTGQNQLPETPLPIFTEPAKLNQAQFSSIWHLRSAQVAQPTEYGFDCHRDIQFRVISSQGYSTKPAGWLRCAPAIPTDMDQPRPANPFSTCAIRRDQCNDPFLASAA